MLNVLNFDFNCNIISREMLKSAALNVLGNNNNNNNNNNNDNNDNNNNN